MESKPEASRNQNMRELFCAHQKNKEQAQVGEVARLYQLVHMD